MDFIDLKTQYQNLKPEIQTRINAVLDHGQYIMGPEIQELEQKLAAYVGAKHCISLSSGTDALLVALMALGVGIGDEIITTPFSFIATAEVIALIGAKPVFVDIDPRTHNIDPALIEAAITSRTRAIIPVSLYGQCADMDAINEIANRHQLAVIEDAAQSFGATYKGQQSCNLSTIGCTSFFPSKPLGCYGDGGACFTNDDQLATEMRQIRVHGQDKRYHHRRLGINARLDTLQAAILLAKLDTFPAEVISRMRIGERYIERLRDHVRVPFIEKHNTSIYGQFTIEVDNRAEMQKGLQQQGIPTAVHYPIPLHKQPVFAEHAHESYPLAERASERVMSLPMHPFLTDTQIDFIADAVRALCLVPV